MDEAKKGDEQEGMTSDMSQVSRPASQSSPLHVLSPTSQSLLSRVYSLWSMVYSLFSASCHTARKWCYETG